MANAILTPSIIAKEALMHLENNLVLAPLVNTDYSSEFNGTVGSTIDVRRPVRMNVQRNNLDVSSFNTDIEDANVAVQMDQTATAKFELTPTELTLDIANPRIQQVVTNAAIKLRDEIEVELAKLYSSVYWFSGTPGTPPATVQPLLDAHAEMVDVAIPADPLNGVHSPATYAKLAGSMGQLQVPRGKVATALERSNFGWYGGFENYRSVHIPRHVVGAHGGTPLVNGASQGVTYAASKATWSQSLVTDGWTNSITNVVRAGDVFTIAGVFAVNPISKQSTGRLQTFVVLENANSGGSTGPATLTISPPMITTGPYQTVTAAPADNAAIVMKTGTASQTYGQSLLFHRDAFLLVTRPLSIASGSGVRTATMSGNRTSISVTERTDFDTLKHEYRLDILFGTKAVAPWLAHRLTA